MSTENISFLPTEYNGWRLETHDIYFDERYYGYVQYQYSVDAETQISIYIEKDGSVWGGALIDSGEPKNPHRDAIKTFESETFEDVISEAKQIMDEPVEQYFR